MGRVLALVVWWVALFWLWLLLVGEWNREQVVAAAIAATVGTAAGEAARRAAGLRPAIRLGTLAYTAKLPYAVAVDFGIVTRALVRSVVTGRVVRGSFHVRRSDPDDPALLTYLAAISPNAYPVDVDTEAGTILVHDLVTRRESEEPV